MNQNFLRLTDRDSNYGPLTIGERSKRYRALGMEFRSGDDEHPGCGFYARGFGWSIRLALPQNFIHTKREWVDLSKETWAHSKGFWQVYPRKFGFTFDMQGALHLYFGPQTDSSVDTKSACYFLPWRQWRMVRHSLYGRLGEHYWTFNRFDEYAEVKDLCPKCKFLAVDYDGTQVWAETFIEEREWHLGQGWFRWLSKFARPRIRRVLNINFEHEVGRDKGSWKGGLMGTGIELLPNELHESAFRRFCNQNIHNKAGDSNIRYLDHG